MQYNIVSRDTLLDAQKQALRCF
ncbi:hypothetical protein [Parafannyhessea umbonata]